MAHAALGAAPLALTHRPVAVSGRHAGATVPQHSGSLPAQQHLRGVRRCAAVCSAPGRRALCVRAVAAAPSAPAALAFPRGSSWEVHKFGGTCVGSSERIRNAAKLMIELSATHKMVVVSAMGTPGKGVPKVTDMLLNMISRAELQDESYKAELVALYDKHAAAAADILTGTSLTDYLGSLEEDVANLKAMLRAISIAGVSAGAFADYVVGHGELWCARLFVASLRAQGAQAVFLDTREVLTVTDASDGGVDVSYDKSNGDLDKWYAANCASTATAPIIVATGFIARTPEGAPTTLKRNGSDYSATIMGALSRAGGITIWTDVDGVYSADPRKVTEAVCLESLSYNEAWELSYFGANVLHPRTTLPAMKFNIPIQIRNFFNLAAPGTRIAEYMAPLVTGGVGAKNPENALVKGFATIENVTLINVEGTGMVGVPGTASNIFSTVRDAGVNVIMISQASSEHSVCFACTSAQAERAVSALEARFANAIAAGRLSRVTTVPNCSILAAVGQQMASTYGVCAMLFEALAKSAINVRAIAQGCSEYNITTVIDGADTERALRAVHARFYLSETPIAVGIVGPGAIGKTLLKQLREQLPTLHSELNMDVRVAGVADSRKMLLAPSGLDLATWEGDFAAQAHEPADLSAFAKALKGSFIPNVVIVDCSASEHVAAYYEEWMRLGIHVITPNKRANSGPYAYYARLRELGRKSYTHYFYEATVGAGLPIISTLQSLRDSGDRISRIEGVFSGTLSYIFNTYTPKDAFSDVVLKAKQLGYTEPDPRDDLSGTDVARKVVILARESGLRLELSDVPIQSLVPEALRGADAAEYLRRLPEFDGEMAAMVSQAEASGEVLRYVGIVDPGPAGSRVELRRYPKSHPFASLSGSDNMMAFTTSRYATQPLIVRGPGAGAEVTAGGVFADLLRLAAYLGAPS